MINHLRSGVDLPGADFGIVNLAPPPVVMTVRELDGARRSVGPGQGNRRSLRNVTVGENEHLAAAIRRIRAGVHLQVTDRHLERNPGDLARRSSSGDHTFNDGVVAWRVITHAQREGVRAAPAEAQLRGAYRGYSPVH